MTVLGPPAAILDALRAKGPVIDPMAVSKLYQPLLAAQPKDGVTLTSDLDYGEHERHRLDVYSPSEPADAPRPVLIFLHGGAFVAGDKRGRANIGWHFARRGIVTVLPNYRLAPEHQWPAGAEDVAAIVAWTRKHIARHGGDPKLIFAGGESAGAVHAAAFALRRRFQPKKGSGLAGAVLVSGLYDVAFDHVAASGAFARNSPTSVNNAYYGDNIANYAKQSILGNLDAPALPVFISYAEWDPPRMQVHSASLLTALTRRDGFTPSFAVIRNHDHISQVTAVNTGDDSLSDPIAAFIMSSAAER